MQLITQSVIVILYKAMVFLYSTAELLNFIFKS